MPKRLRPSREISLNKNQNTSADPCEAKSRADCMMCIKNSDNNKCYGICVSRSKQLKKLVTTFIHLPLCDHCSSRLPD